MPESGNPFVLGSRRNPEGNRRGFDFTLRTCEKIPRVEFAKCGALVPFTHLHLKSIGEPSVAY